MTIFWRYIRRVSKKQYISAQCYYHIIMHHFKVAATIINQHTLEV
jgi:hypothetical protein